MIKEITKDFDWSTTNFEVREFVPKSIYNLFGAESYRFISPFMVNVVQAVRDLSGRGVFVNTWAWNKDGHNYRGYRPPLTRVGARFSLHKTSNAVDFNVSGMRTSAVHKLIFDNHDLFWNLGVRRLEHPAHTPKWTHLDNKGREGQTKIRLFKP